MNHQAVSEIFFVTEAAIAGLGRVQLSRALQEVCISELRAHVRSELRLRALGITHHGADLRFEAATAAVTGWVERLGEHHVVFRVVAMAEAIEILDASMTVGLFEVRPAENRLDAATDPDSQCTFMPLADPCPVARSHSAGRKPLR